LEKTYIKDLLIDIWDFLTKLTKSIECSLENKKNVTFNPNVDIISSSWKPPPLETKEIDYDVSEINQNYQVDRPISTHKIAPQIDRRIDNPEWQDKDISLVHDQLSFENF
jgi:hypothetical protein